MKRSVESGVIAPLVSVITPVYRGERFVSQAVQSVLDQTYPNIELIIVNDGSPDRSREILAPLLGLPKVRYVEQKNAGVAAARNTGLRLARGEFIALVDQDDLWYPQKLALQIDCFRRKPALGLVHGDVSYIDDAGRPLPRDPYFPANVSGRCLRQLFCGNPVMTCSVLFTRAAVERVGGFDDAIRFSDDYDLWLRMAAAGYEFAYIDRPIAKYRLHGANESRDTIGIVSATLQVLRKALRAIPGCRELVGGELVDRRLSSLECALSRVHFENRRWSLFAWHVCRALWYHRATAFQRGLPGPALDRLRWYSKRLGLR